jgi:hypothetical protein
MDVNRFFHGFLSEMRKVGAEVRSIEQIARGKPARIALPENRKPMKEQARGADVAA